MRWGGLLTLGIAARAWGQMTYCPEVAQEDYSDLRAAAQECGTLSKGLSAIADYCFDREGNWNAGYIAVYTSRGQSPPTEPSGRCAEAVQFCLDAAATVAAHGATHDRNSSAIEAMQRTYYGKRFALRPDVLSLPDPAYSCNSRNQAKLRQAAQNRMGIAERHQHTAEAHVSFKSWLWGLDMQCKNVRLEEERVKRERDAAEKRKQAQEQEQQQQRDNELRRQREQAEQQRARQQQASSSDPYRIGGNGVGHKTSQASAVDPRVAAAQQRAAEAEQRMRLQQEQARQAFQQGEEHRQRAAEMIRTGRGDAINETLQGQLANMRGAALQGGHTQAAAAINRNQARLATTQAAVGAGVAIAGGLINAIANARAREQARREAEEERRAQREEAEQLAKIERERADAIERQAQADLARAREEARVARHLAVAATLKSDAPSIAGSADAAAAPPVALRPMTATPAGAASAPSVSTPPAGGGIVLRPMASEPPRMRRLLIIAPAGCAITARGADLSLQPNVAAEIPATLSSLSLRAECNAEAQLFDGDASSVVALRRGRLTPIPVSARAP